MFTVMVSLEELCCWEDEIVPALFVNESDTLALRLKSQMTPSGMQ